MTRTHCKHGHELIPENTYIPPKAPNVRACKKCRIVRAAEYASRNRDRRREDGRLRGNRNTLSAHQGLSRYGLSLSDYEHMVREQEGRCAVCALPESKTNKVTGIARRLSVDHDHETGQVRKLLCDDCNVLIGRAKESSATLRSAAEYIDSHQRAKLTLVTAPLG